MSTRGRLTVESVGTVTSQNIQRVEVRLERTRVSQIRWA